MRRDFSESTKQKLLTLAAEVGGDRPGSVFDAINDLFISIGGVGGRDDLINVDRYYAKIVDKNDYSKSKIEQIFSNVANVDTSYATRFAALTSQALRFKYVLNKAALAVAPANGSFEPGAMDALKNELDDYCGARDMYAKVAGSGLTSADLGDLTSESNRQYLADLLGVMSNYVPNVQVGETFEMAIGPGLVLYYSVTAVGDYGSDVTWSVKMSDDKQSFENFSYSSQTEGPFSAGGTVSTDGSSEISVSYDGTKQSTSYSYNDKGEVVITITRPAGDRTYTEKTVIGTVTQSYEESVKTELNNDASLTSTMGVRHEDTEASTWVYLPVESEATSTATSLITHLYEAAAGNIPTIDVDWETIKTGSQIVLEGVTCTVLVQVAGYIVVNYGSYLLLVAVI